MSEVISSNEEVKISNEEVQNRVEIKETMDTKNQSPSVVGIVEGMIEYALRKLIFWENDDKRVGIIIRFFHNAFFYMMLLIYIINHTVFPSYILFVVFYCVYFIIWLQHIFCGDCIIHHIENRLLGDKKSVLSPFMELFNIHSDEYNSKILVMATTLVAFMLTFELITRTIFLFKSWLF